MYQPGGQARDRALAVWHYWPEPQAESWQFPQPLHSRQGSNKGRGHERDTRWFPSLLPDLYLRICHFPLGWWLPAPSPVPPFSSEPWQCCSFSLLINHIFYFLYSDALISWGLAAQFLKTCQVAGLSCADQPIQS